MAIQAIPEPNAAYQGSVPGTERASAGMENITVASKVEAPSPKGEAKAASDMEEGAKNGSDAGSEGTVQGTETIKKAVDEINRNAKHSEAVFGVHDRTNRITIKIVDKDTKKVLKEYPPEKMLDMIAKVWEMAGLMVDEKR